MNFCESGLMHWHILFLYQTSVFPCSAKASLSASISRTGHFCGQALLPLSVRIGIRAVLNFSSWPACSTRSMMHRSPRLFPIRKILVSLPKKSTSDRNQSQSDSVTVSLRASSSSCGSSMITKSGLFAPHDSPRTAAPFPYASMRTVSPVRYATSSASPLSSRTFAASPFKPLFAANSRDTSRSFLLALRCVAQIITR